MHRTRVNARSSQVRVVGGLALTRRHAQGRAEPSGAAALPMVRHESQRKEAGLTMETIEVVHVRTFTAGCRSRLDEPLDEESRVGDLLAGRLERRDPVPHVPPLAPYLVDHS